MLNTHHLDSETKSHSFREISRVFKPGGNLITGDWGKAKSKFRRAVFYAIQLVDDFSTTYDNVKVLLPKYMSEAGFSDVSEKGFTNTKIGSFTYYQGRKET